MIWPSACNQKPQRLAMGHCGKQYLPLSSCLVTEKHKRLGLNAVMIKVRRSPNGLGNQKKWRRLWSCQAAQKVQWDTTAMRTQLHHVFPIWFHSLPLATHLSASLRHLLLVVISPIPGLVPANDLWYKPPDIIPAMIYIRSTFAPWDDIITIIFYISCSLVYAIWKFL